MSEQDSFRWRSAEGGLVIILGLVTAIGAMTTDIYVPAMPAIQHAIGAQAAGIQATLSVYLIGLAVGQLFHGPLSDRHGRKAPLAAGLLIYVAGSLICAAAPSIWVLLAGRLVQALGASAGVVVVRAIVTDRFQGVTAARVHTMLMQILSLAAIVAPLLGGLIIERASWRGIFLLLAGVGVVGLVAMLRLLKESLPADRRTTNLALDQVRAYGQLFAKPDFILLCLASSATLASMFALIMGASFVFIDGFGWSAFEYAILYMATSVGFLICGYANDRALLRWPLRAILWPAIVVQTLAAIALLAAAFVGASTAPLMAALVIVLIANLGFVHGNLIAMSMERVRDAAGAGASLLGVAQYGISALAAGVAGLIGSNAMLSMAGSTLLFTGLATVACVGGLRLQPREQPAPG